MVISLPSIRFSLLATILTYVLGFIPFLFLVHALPLELHFPLMEEAHD